jgi:hypothetical protein
VSRRPGERSRRYDKSEPAALGDVISQLFALRGYGRTQGNKQLENSWAEVVGSDISEQTKVMGLKNGVLQIGVSNSALISELSAFLKPEFLEKFQTDYSHLKIKDIKFKLRGSLSK